ncbi:MAG: aspartate aminotransferase family protein [Terrimicrobiaceae bacterium]|nr:aspartate aminotransferase family protein [Terrimicrobiaceae bacterium]
MQTGIPGPESLRLAGELRRYESRNVTFTSADFPIFWERASGANVWDVDGNRFLDLTSAFAVAGLGHSPPAIVAALRAQSERLVHAMGDVHPTREKAELCRLLSEITFERWNRSTGRTILANSGSEAVEAALKTALLHSGRPGVISFTGGYHGLGYGALETIGIPFFREPFRPQLGRFGVRLPYPGCYRCPFDCRDGYRLAGGPFPNCSSGCIGELRDRIETALRQREVGAILVEPMQGRGGEVVPPRDFLRLLREVCDAHKVLLIFDEIYTGFHRTGRLFACEHFDVVPDIICLGKALTSGFPLSACVGRSDVMQAWPESTGEALHTSTYLGNPLGCAMALASIREHLRPEAAALVRETSRALDESLAALRAPAIGDVRGLGLMRGVELIAPDGSPDAARAGDVVVRALKDGIVLLAGSPHGNVLSLTPPFGIEREELTFALAKIQEYVTSRPGSIS